MTLETWKKLSNMTPAEASARASNRAEDQALVDRLTTDQQRIANEIAQATARIAEYDAQHAPTAPTSDDAP